MTNPWGRAMRGPHRWSATVRILKTPGTAILITLAAITPASRGTRMTRLIMPGLACCPGP
jgi:hypothetical protein